jgi:hypothetical protein
MCSGMLRRECPVEYPKGFASATVHAFSLGAAASCVFSGKNCQVRRCSGIRPLYMAQQSFLTAAQLWFQGHASKQKQAVSADCGTETDNLAISRKPIALRGAQLIINHKIRIPERLSSVSWLSLHMRSRSTGTFERSSLESRLPSATVTENS